MKWLALILIIANVAAFFLFRADEGQAALVDLPRTVGSARLILIDELNFTERNALRIDAVREQVPVINTPVVDEFNLLRQPLAQVEEGDEALDDGTENPDIAALEGQCEIIEAQEQSLPAIVDRLKSVGMNPYFVEEVSSSPGPLMVYIQPFDSAREAALELNVLRREDIESFIIPEGELQNGISVGVFSTEQNALTRSAELGELGYQTDVYQYQLEESYYSINLPLIESSVLSVEYWRELESDFPSISRVQNSCF